MPSKNRGWGVTSTIATHCFYAFKPSCSVAVLEVDMLVVYFEDISLSTRGRVDAVDITSQVEGAVSSSGVENGVCLVYTHHSTSAIITNEHESGLVHDILAKIDQTFPRSAGYQHDRVDDNANAHLGAVFLGPSQTFPVRGGNLLRGTWQNIFFIEMDGPRSRRVTVEVLGT
jgi:secondary thiamine-phosphate synthase enzyme